MSITKETRERISEMFDAGLSRAEVFAEVTTHPADGELAHYIATHPVPRLCEENRWKIRAFVALLGFNMLLSMASSFVIGARLGPVAGWTCFLISGGISTAMIWGACNHNIAAYNVYLAFTLVGAAQAVQPALFGQPVETASLAFCVGLSAFVAYTRYRLFPDVRVLGIPQTAGQYRFAD